MQNAKCKMRMWIGDDIVNRCSHWCGNLQVLPRTSVQRMSLRTSAHTGVAIRFPKPSPEKSGAPRANQNRNDCKCQSYLNLAQTGVVIRIPKPSLPGKVEWRGRERSHGRNSWTMFTSSTRAIYCQGTPHFAVCLGIFQSSARISFFGLAPMDFFTTWPFWKTSKVGMLAIR